MLLSDFDFDLPEELIAQEPAEKRESSRLMLLDRETGAIAENLFADFPSLLRAGDLLVMNDTRVIPARLLGYKDSGGKVEIFLSRPHADGSWECLLKASKKPAPGGRLHFPGATATVLERTGETWRIAFSVEGDFMAWLEGAGSVPLPPYIHRAPLDRDRERYQTVYARERGAVAAPTAGLHFTPRILEEVRAAGAETATVTLHVGLGTFFPIRVDDIRDHRMHRERYSIPAGTAAEITRCRERGGRVIAIGTTSARALEHCAAVNGSVTAGEGEADIFIYPGYRFRVVDALLTNFHLPKSTLLLLVSAFAGRERVLAAYREAVARRFRFFSYGDAMFIS